MVSQSNTASKAGTITRAYRGPNNLTDWYLPSKDELIQMCKWQRGIAWGSDATACTTGGTLNSGTGASGFVDLFYWSSYESTFYQSEPRGFQNGGQGTIWSKSSWYYVRPMRAFG
jgi:hypothetical protein